MIRRTLDNGEIVYFDPATKHLFVLDTSADRPDFNTYDDLAPLVEAGTARVYNEEALRTISKALTEIVLLW
jgi:hypothetical protein